MTNTITINSALSLHRARELLRYDQGTGKLYWRVSPANNVKAGDEAGSTFSSYRNTYRKVRVEDRQYCTHRLIWLIVTGSWPEGQIDHIDGNGLNNRWANLRAATNQQNQQNCRMRVDNTSSVTGVYWSRRNKKWRVQICANGKWKHLGLFAEIEDAAAARKAAERKYGFHENHGRAE